MFSSFAEFARFSAEKTFKHRDYSQDEFDETLVGDYEQVLGHPRKIYAEWAAGGKKVYSGIIDGGEELVLPNADGQKEEVIVMGHFNVQRNFGELIRHYITIDGRVIAGSTNFRTLPDVEIEALLAEFTDPQPSILSSDQ